MLKVTVDRKKHVCDIHGEGSTFDYIVDLCELVNGVYATLVESDTRLGAPFRETMREAMREDSPVWDVSEDTAPVKGVYLGVQT